LQAKKWNFSGGIGGSIRKKRKGFHDMKRLYQVETKEKHKMKNYLLKRKQTRTEGWKKQNKGVKKVMSKEETPE
jgi:hypothetical protein